MANKNKDRKAVKKPKKQAYNSKGMALNNPYPNVPVQTNNLPGFNFGGAIS